MGSISRPNRTPFRQHPPALGLGHQEFDGEGPRLSNAADLPGEVVDEPELHDHDQLSAWELGQSVVSQAARTSQGGSPKTILDLIDHGIELFLFPVLVLAEQLSLRVPRSLEATDSHTQ